ncbi:MULTISPECIES: hypothetical protein [Curtobacterium]|uniref:Major facilitator superfamily (MFS) profile domain-containing protein n=1 Tax=Curtobacterium poinsettiae TaxID=159612 RepID=A0ABT3S3G9_9MICO|nr:MULTISPECIES: hypothetical protein [Curtobacterium]MBF4599030.1 hypothetical protein [Curtobacterium sp. VKM Ac-1796]MBF4610783.1 hypothetical protein [Curtobacterium sp. VKM Ac-2889]MBT1596621.1 hypothetical protein [Curtobacterium flaccumfaciens pv. flaccumfaciens]MBT1610929.1 hypothetical protein [Curtobacterium flaccumfaciens pv. poinsettiae]MCS6564835.1 hypothetical protein [Curtobacterium flaccumfaciens pv. flaccumfaciens]
MQMREKQRAVNLGFGVGIALILVGLLMIWFAPAVWSGWATFVVVIGVLSALVGFVFALVPANGRR